MKGYVGGACPETAFPSCERHRGAFSSGFSSGFDIDRIDCRFSSIKLSPTLRIWDSSPYFGFWDRIGFGLPWLTVEAQHLLGRDGVQPRRVAYDPG